MASKGVLLPFQKEFYSGVKTHKYAIWLASRQIGKSFTVSFIAIDTCLEKDGSTVIVVSASERQAVELLNKVKLHVRAFKALKLEFFEDVKTNVHRVELPNGSRILSVPANPDTVRGFSSDLLILDEFAFVQHDEELWKAVFPMITRRKSSKLAITSTPKGKNNMFYKLWTEAQKDPLWHTQKTTIYDAVKMGLDIDVEALRRGIRNEEAWRQEYLCEFVDEAGTLLPYELIQTCELKPEEILINDLRDLKGDAYIGVDVGRRRDLTVISVLEKLGDVLYLRKLEILHKLPFREQLSILDHFARYARRVAIDETGIGMQMAEELQKKWGETKVLRVYFTARTKEELAERLKAKFQDRLIRVPADEDLREDLHSVQKTITPAGNIRYEGSTENSHADRFWSLALAVYAGSQEEPPKVHVPFAFASAKPYKGEKRWDYWAI